MQNVDTELISTSEAAKVIGEGVRQVIRRVERGELVPVKKLPGLRGAFLFNRSDIDVIAMSPDTPRFLGGAK